eukprot:1177597-Prorocentrum_minimum.AAC.14
MVSSIVLESAAPPPRAGARRARFAAAVWPAPHAGTPPAAASAVTHSDAAAPPPAKAMQSQTCLVSTPHRGIPHTPRPSGAPDNRTRVDTIVRLTPVKHFCY